MSKESTERIEQESIEWLVRRDGSDWSAADAADLQKWLGTSIENEVAFIRLEFGWEQARRLKALGTGVEEGVVPPPGQWKVSPFFEQTSPSQGHAFEDETPSSTSERPFRAPDAKVRSRTFWSNHWLATAASVLLPIGALGYYLFGLHFGDRYTTPLGGIAAVPMSDGSRVTLNTASEIRVAVSDIERTVELTKGEAFFEVSKDPKRPFIVQAGNKRIVAVGTAFSVRREGEDVEVVVTEGEVRVEFAKRFGSTEERVVAARPESLIAGKVARVNAEGLLVEKKQLADLQERLAWRAGYLVFNDTPLAKAAAEFNRYSTEKIVIDDPSVASYRVSGKFRSTSLGAFVRLAENAFPIEVRHEDDLIRLSARQ